MSRTSESLRLPIGRLLPRLLLLLLAAACGSLRAAASGDGASDIPKLRATWVHLAPVAANPYDGMPGGRCDHTFEALTGRSLKPNDEVPFPDGNTPPTTDPYYLKFWVYGGHRNNGLSDSWLLDASVTPPTWTKINTSADGEPAKIRWGTPVVLIPNGLDPQDVGLTAVVYGGCTTDLSAPGYYNDISTFNIATGRWSTWAPQPAAFEASMPYPRGYTEWVNVPEGYSTGAVAPDAPDSGMVFLLGGLGTRNWEHNSLLDEDSNDQWLYNLTGKQWTRFDTQRCVQNLTDCSDAVTLSSLLDDQINNGSSSPVDVNFSASLRPEDVIPVYQRLLATMLHWNATVSHYENTPDACTTRCIKFGPYENDTTIRPPRLEGTRMARIGNKTYAFGGYLCTAQGVIVTGGNDCFLSGMWILDWATMLWTVIESPDPTDPSAAFWPSRRAYNTIAAHPGRGLIIVQGGYFLDTTGVAFWYNDVYAFDVNLLQFIELEALGIPPEVQWSAAAAVVGDDMYLSGGCQNANYWPQVMMLRLGMYIQATNCQAFGPGLFSAIAGEGNSFFIQTRDVSAQSGSVSNGTVWGSNATYGTGLASHFSAQLITSFGDPPRLILQAATVDEIGGGLYEVSYALAQGSAFQVFILYDLEAIPGSPFDLQLVPDILVGPVHCGAEGLGLSLVEKGGEATLLVEVADQYGNSYVSQRFLESNAYTLSDDVLLPDPATQRVIFPASAGGNFSLQAQIVLDGTPLLTDYSVRNFHNGTFLIRYKVPSEYDSFQLHVHVDQQPVIGSPFAVMALTPIVIPRSLVEGMWSLAFIMVAVCIACSVVVYKFRKETMMRSSSPRFLQLLILGCVISTLSVPFFVMEGNVHACRAAHTLLTTGLVLTMSSLLAKSSRVVRIFNLRKLKVPTNLSDSRLLIPTLGVTAIMLLLNLLWIGIDPMQSEIHPSNSHPDVLTYHVCTSDHAIEWVATMLAFCGVVLLYGVYIAIKTGHLPEAFNESKMIAAAVYNIFFCCVFVVPIMFFLGSNSDFVIGRLVLISLAVLWCALFNLAVLIGPKILLLMRQRRTQNSTTNATVLPPPQSSSSGNVNHEKIPDGSGGPLSPSKTVPRAGVQMSSRLSSLGDTPASGARISSGMVTAPRQHDFDPILQQSGSNVSELYDEPGTINGPAASDGHIVTSRPEVTSTPAQPAARPQLTAARLATLPPLPATKHRAPALPPKSRPSVAIVAPSASASRVPAAPPAVEPPVRENATPSPPPPPPTA